MRLTGRNTHSDTGRPPRSSERHSGAAGPARRPTFHIALRLPAPVATFTKAMLSEPLSIISLKPSKSHKITPGNGSEFTKTAARIWTPAASLSPKNRKWLRNSTNAPHLNWEDYRLTAVAAPYIRTAPETLCAYTSKRAKTEDVTAMRRYAPIAVTNGVRQCDEGSLKKGVNPAILIFTARAKPI